MKGKTQLRKKHLRCSSLDTLPLSTSTLTLFTSNKTASSADKMFSGSHTILLAIEQLLSMAEPILPDILTTCRLFRLSFVNLRFLPGRVFRARGGCKRAGARRLTRSHTLLIPTIRTASGFPVGRHPVAPAVCEPALHFDQF